MTWSRRDGLAVAFLALLPWLFFLPLFVPGAGRQFLAEGDFVDQFYAFASFEVSELAAGRAPLWNPYAYSGSPFWADVQSAVAYPPSLAVSLPAAATLGRLPLLALEIEAVGHIALAAVLMYVFARTSLRRRDAAVVAALAFSLGGYLTGYPPLQLAVLETAVWLPPALLGAEWIATGSAALPGRRTIAGVVVTGVAMAMAILAGHPQTTMYVAYATVAFFGWRTRPWSGATLRSCAAFAGALLLALGLSAAGWLPALEYLRLSNRAVMDYAALAHGFPPRELLGVVLPGITLWSPLYVGVLPLLLATAAARRAVVGPHPSAEPPCRPGPPVFWLLLGGAAVLLSVGGNAFTYDVAYLLAPGFDLFRGQERAAFLVSFSLAMLAGHGVVALHVDRAATARTIGSAALLLAAGGALLAFVAGPDLRSAPLHVVVASLAAAALVRTATRTRDHDRLLGAGALALIVLDLFVASAGVDLQRGAPGELELAPALRSLPAESQRVRNDDRLPRNFGMLHGIESTYGASPLRLGTYESLYEGLQGGGERLDKLLAVNRVLTDRPALEPLALSAQPVDIAGVRSYLHVLPDRPYVWRVASGREVASDEEALSSMAAPDFDPYATVLLAPSGGDVPFRTVGAPPPESAAVLVERRPGLVVARTDGAADGWLVFSENHYPGWRATVDGEPAAVRRANVALVAVSVPAGAHTVRLELAAPLVGAGLAVSMAAAIVLAGLAVHAARAPDRRDHAGRPR